MGKFTDEFQKAKIEIENHMAEIVQSAASKAVSSLFNLSPVWSGSYMLSHRMSINGEPVAGPTYAPPPFGFGIPIYVDKAKHRMVEALFQKILSIKAFGTVEFSNSILHCIDVEYLGTPRRPEGWHVYAITEAAIRQRRYNT